ncbi:MAG: STAS domain-containing protein [Magnetococcus sp. XQGC-1]
MKIFKEGNRVIIHAPKTLGFDLRNEFRTVLSDYPTGTSYEMDLQMVEKIDSAGLGMLLLLKEHAQLKNNTASNVVLRNAQPEVLKLLRLVNFHQLFTIL